MSSENLEIDANNKVVAGAITDDTNKFIKMLRVDNATGGLKVSIVGGGGTGTVTSVSVVSANGFAGTVATATTTPAITLSTTITGLLKGNGTALSAAVAGTDYADASFKTISISGQSDVVADSASDTLTLVAGTNITLTTNAATDTITINSSGGASGLTVGSTTIASGTTTRILYDNAGVLGEYTLTGSGTVVAMATSPTFQTSINGAYLTASTILITDGSSNIISAAVATYPSLTELSYVKGVTSAIQTQINAKGAGTVTAIGVTTANGVSGSSSGGATPNLTITLGAITPTTVNGNTFTTGTYTLTGQAGKTLTFNGSITLTGTDAQTYTFPTTTATIARTDAGQTFTGVQTMTSPVFNTGISGTAFGTGIPTFLLTPSSANLISAVTDETGSGSLVFATSPTLVTPLLGTPTSGVLTNCTGLPAASVVAGTLGSGTFTTTRLNYTNNAITASANAATVPITSSLSTVTNNSAATLTITMTTTSAVDGQMTIVRILDSSAAAQTITWVNTENSTVTAPVTSNGSTTLFLTVGFIYNGGTSKWRCIASA